MSTPQPQMMPQTTAWPADALFCPLIVKVPFLLPLQAGRLRFSAIKKGNPITTPRRNIRKSPRLPHAFSLQTPPSRFGVGGGVVMRVY